MANTICSINQSSGRGKILILRISNIYDNFAKFDMKPATLVVWRNTFLTTVCLKNK